MKKNYGKPTNINALSVINEINDKLTKSPDFLYNGGFESYEDPADYLRSIKAVRLG